MGWDHFKLDGVALAIQIVIQRRRRNELSLSGVAFPFEDEFERNISDHSLDLKFDEYLSGNKGVLKVMNSSCVSRTRSPCV